MPTPAEQDTASHAGVAVQPRHVPNSHNSTLWPGFTWEYRRRTRRFDRANYDLISRSG